jgi:hypothetical protein
VDPDRIRLSYSGADELRIDPSGALVLRAGGAQVRQAPPVVYQLVAGVKREVQGRYLLHGAGQVGFALAGYDTGLPPVIDPVITYSTYLGGSGDDFSIWSDIDRAGNFYVTGFTTPHHRDRPRRRGIAHVAGATGSTDFPVTPGSLQTANAGAFDAFLEKVDLEKRHTGSGQRAGSVTVESSDRGKA